MRAANDESTTGAREAQRNRILGQCVATVFKAITTERVHAASAAFSLGQLADAYRAPQCHDDDLATVHEFLEGFKSGFVEGTFPE